VGYAQATDFALYGLPSAALGATFTPDDVQRALDGASSLVDGYLAKHYTLPLIAPFPLSLVQKVCHLAQFDLLAVRGFNPEQGGHVTARMRYEDAISWCKDVGAARVEIDATDSSSGDPNGEFVVQAPQGSVVVVSGGPSSLRGW
jgi:phage gp36-like protein